MNVRIRDAAPSEVADLLALQRRASDIWDSDRDWLAAHPEAIELPESAAAEGRVRVAVVDGRIAGFTVVLPEVDGSVELDGLFVEPELMRRGIGGLLVRDAAERARAAGASELAVIANDNALAFYEREGFVGRERVPTAFLPGMRMRLRLGG